MLLASVAAGVALMLADRRPASVTASMPALLQGLWEIGLVLAGVIGLIGITWRGHLSTSMGVELIGVTVLGTATTMYGIALFVVSGAAAIAAGAFVCAVAVASWARVWQIVRDLRRIARAAQDGTTTDVTLLAERDPR